jgi:hypothetical protein
MRKRLRRDRDDGKRVVARPYEEKRIEWPPPRDDPDREPSHPGARKEKKRGADT